MKLRITRKDLEELTLEQKQNLCDLWIPHIYDTAVATVCVDAAEDRYEQIVYAIGGIKLLKHPDMLLYDLKFKPDETFKSAEEDAYSDGVSEDAAGPANTTEAENADLADEVDFDFDEDFSFEFQRPESYNKKDCLPLLDIGQMIDILERKNFGNNDFYLSAATHEHFIEMGKSDFTTNSYSNENDNSCELCDILWESLKAVL